jgi:hypothetical protein
LFSLILEWFGNGFSLGFIKIEMLLLLWKNSNQTIKHKQLPPQTMQTRNKTYSSIIKGKFYEETEAEMTLKIGKALIDMRHQDESLVVRIPKLLKLIRIINDNYDKVSFHNGTICAYGTFNKVVYLKTFEFEQNIRRFQDKHLEQMPTKLRTWKMALKELETFRTNYRKYQAYLRQQLQDCWFAIGDGDGVGGGGRHATKNVFDDNVSSLILEYLF